MKGLLKFGSPWALAIFFLAGTKTGRRISKSVADEAVKTGKVIADKSKEVIAQIQESASNIVEEARAELQTSKSNGHHVDVTVE